MLEELLALLNATEIPFVMYRWDRSPTAPYGILTVEGGADSAVADDRIECQTIRGSIDLFAPNSNSSWPGIVQAAINGHVSWRLNSVQYESTARLVHYEWIFEAVGAYAVNQS